jgi:hypothetical protein
MVDCRHLGVDRKGGWQEQRVGGEWGVGAGLTEAASLLRLHDMADAAGLDPLPLQGCLP